MPAIPQPGVTVVQEFQTASPTVSSATLPASIIGPAFEVIDVLLADGTVNAGANAGAYEQMPESILQASFPNPRGNINELNVDEDSIRAFLLFGGLLTELPRGDGAPTGSAFLSSLNPVRRAALQSVIKDADAGWIADVLGGRSLVLSFNSAAGDTSKDITVTLPGVGVVSAADLIAAINTAAGAAVAVAATVGGGNGILIRSTVFGAAGSVTVRGSNAVATALFGCAGDELRVEGAGYRGQDDGDGDLVTPWVEFFVGRALRANVVQAFGVTPSMGLVDNDGVFAAAAAPSLTFTTAAADIPLQAATSSRAGDLMYAGGARVRNAEIIDVQNGRFRFGVLNSALSTFDSEGNATTRVYDNVEVNTLLHGSPFAPNDVWFQAQGLQFGSISPTPVAASLVGTNTGRPAQPAEVQSSFVTGALVLTGLTLIISYIKDGVSQPQLTLTLTSDPANSAALQAEIIARLTAAGVNADFSVVVWDDLVAGNSFVHISTTALGDDQSLTVLATGTANTALGFSNVSDTSHTGKDVEFAGQAAVTGASIAEPIAGLDGTLITVTVVDSRGTHVLSWTAAAMDGTATVALLAPLLEAQANQLAWDGDIKVLDFSNTGDQLIMTSVEAGAAVSIDVTAAGGDGGTALGFTDGVNDTDTGSSDLSGNLFRWMLNDSQCSFEATFSSDSLEDAVSVINLVHGEFAIASISGSSLVLTSPLQGVASHVAVDDTSGDSSATATALGFLAGVGANDDSDTAALPSLAGSGRPNPDFFVDSQGDVQLSAEILRNTLTGQPFCPASAGIYLDFNALRLDVSPLSLAQEKLLTIDDTTILETILSPLDQRNPLGLGMFLALLNSPTTPVTGIGVDEVSAAQPMGTVDGYSRAADVLEAKDVYALAPLSGDELVHQLFATHVSAMSQPSQRGERILFINPEVPDRAFPTTLASGEANSTASSNELALDSNPTGGIVTAGLNPAALAADDGVYVEVSVGGAFRRYSVSLVNGMLSQFRVAFAAGENDDGFYTTTPLTESVIDQAYAIKIRGAALLLPGSSLPDNSGIADAMASLAGSYKNRRVFAVFPDSVDIDLDSGTTTQPGYYACAAIAGMVGQENPSQPFTNVPITGLSKINGSQDTFKPALLDTIAGGGVYILHQTVPGAPATCRHQLSTDVSSIERRELSITKAVDYVAKYLRNVLRNFIGNQNITSAFLDQLSTVTQAQLAFLGTEGLGVVAGATLNSLVQDESSPDTVLVDITLRPLYPANYIRVTLVV